MESEGSFKTLEKLGSTISGLGWVVIAIAAIGGIVFLLKGGVGTLTGIVVLVMGIAQGIIIVAMGQTIQCLVAIEHNTAATSRFTRISATAASQPGESELSQKCPQCGETWEGDSWYRFCPSCGKGFEEETVTKKLVCEFCQTEFPATDTYKFCPDCGRALKMEQG